MPRLPPVDMSPHTRLRATFWPGVGYSVVTFDQSHSSSSATSWSEPGERALTDLGAGDANDHRVVRADHHPGIDLRRAVLRANDLRAAERKVEAERQPAAHGRRAHHEAAAIDLRYVIHGCLPLHAQHPQQRGVGVDIDLMSLSIHVEISHLQTSLHRRCEEAMIDIAVTPRSRRVPLFLKTSLV